MSLSPLRMLQRGLRAATLLLAGAAFFAACSEETSDAASFGVRIAEPSADAVLFPSRPIRFTAELTNAPAGLLAESVRYDWRFGDGQELIGAGPTAEHAFIGSGTYTVSVAAREVQGDKTVGVTRTSLTLRLAEPADLVALGPSLQLTTGTVTSTDTLRCSYDVQNLASQTLLPFKSAVFAILEQGTATTLPASAADLAARVTAGTAFLIAEQEVQPMGAAPARQQQDFAAARMPDNAPSGIYRALAAVDSSDDIGELDEGNNYAFADRSFAYSNTSSTGANLRVRDVTVRPPRANTLSNIIVDAVLYNLGTTPAILFKFDVWLSRDPIWDEADRLLGEGDVASVLASGTYELRGFSAAVNPPVTELGNYYVIIRADSGAIIDEVIESDNTAASGAIIVTDEELPGADITVGNLVVAPTNTFLDGTVDISATVSNVGTGDITNQFLCRTFLSSDDQLDPRTDAVLESFTVPPLAAGASVDLLREANIPGFFEAGSYFAFLYCDPNLSIAEADDGNNTARTEGQIVVAGESSVDLRINGLTLSAESVDNEGELTVSLEVCNDGSNGSTPTKLRIFLSPDNLPDPDDILFAELRLAPIEPASCVTLEAVAPAICATFVSDYRVLAVADPTGSVVEVNETNNLFVYDRPLQISGAVCACTEDPYEPNESPVRPFYLDPAQGTYAELTMCFSAIEWYAVPLFRGESLRVQALFDNARGNLDMVLYGPDRATILDRSESNGDIEEVSYLSAAQRGDYLLKVAGRSPEDRNVYTLQLSVTSALPGTDLAILNVATSNARPLLGETVDVTFDAVNLGIDDAPGSTARIYLSNDATIDPVSDLRLGEVVVPPFSERTQMTVPITLPDSSGGGDFYLGVIGDARNEIIGELDEGNNTGVSPLFTIDATCFDTLEPNNTAAAAHAVDLSGAPEVTLDGLLACSDNRDFYRFCVADGDYLNVTATFDGGIGDIDLRLLQGDGAEVDRSESVSGSETVGVDFVTGDQCYTLDLYVAGRDREVPYQLTVARGRAPIELQCVNDAEPNNTFASAALLRDWLDADLSICPENDDDYFRVGPLAQGTRLTFSLSAAATDSAVPADLRLSLWQDASTFISNTVTATERLSYTVAVPNQLIYARVRSLGASARNQRYRIAVEGLVGTDLIANGFAVTPGIATGGQLLSYEFELANALNASAAPFKYALYLSTDTALDADDRLLREVSVPGLAGLNSVLEGRKVRIPTDLPAAGRYYVILKLDSDEVVPELSERNNLYLEPIEVLAACLADLAEPNDFVFDAPPAADFSGVPLSICPGDQDWFALPVVGNRAVSVQIAFSHAAADLDLYMFDEDGVLVASSDTLADVEAINYLPSAGGIRFVQVVAFDSSAAGSYVMTVE